MQFRKLRRQLASRPKKESGRVSAVGPDVDSVPFDSRRISSHISEHIAQFIGLIALGILVLFVLMVVFMYINSVFRFILFDSVLRRHCSISQGWGKWHRAGRRFFLWQIVFLISTWLLLAILLGLPLALAFAAGWMRDLREHVGRLIIGGILLVGLFIVFALAAAVVQALAKIFWCRLWLSRISILPTAGNVCWR